MQLLDAVRQRKHVTLACPAEVGAPDLRVHSLAFRCRLQADAKYACMSRVRLMCTLSAPSCGLPISELYSATRTMLAGEPAIGLETLSDTLEAGQGSSASWHSHRPGWYLVEGGAKELCTQPPVWPLTPHSIWGTL